MKRRDVLAAAPFAGLAAVTAGAVPVKAMEQGGFETFVTPRDRLAFIAETLGVSVPAGLPSELEDHDGAPCVEVLAFCEETGASLDYIYLGDIRAMFRGIYYRHRAAKTETPVMVLFREWQTASAYEDAVYAANPEGEGPECEAASYARRQADERIMAEPSRNALDVLAKLGAITCFGIVGSSHDDGHEFSWAEARAMVEGWA